MAEARQFASMALAGAALLLVAGLVAFNLGGLDGSAEVRDLVVNYAFLPRLCISLLCGAALGLAGVLFQQLLQNPLAAPDTLGITSGAQLSLTLGILYLPEPQARHPALFAVAGACVAWALIALVVRRRDPGPVSLILTGFIVSFTFGSIASLMMMLNQDYLTSLLIWGAGSLVQTDWTAVEMLAPTFVAAVVVVAILARPLLILGFGDHAAGSLGVSLRVARPMLIATAVLLSAGVVAAVGVIGFVGLAAPHLARVLGAQKLGARLLLAPLAGAGLVAFVDQAVQAFSDEQSNALPSGAITALLGAPLLIVLLRRVPGIALETLADRIDAEAETGRSPRSTLLVLGLLALAVLAVAFLVGRTPSGLSFGLALDQGAFVWRFPRVLGAAGAGMALGVAGCLVQRLFANPMASPEVLGIGGGVAVGLILALLWSADAGAGPQFAGAFCGALAVAVLVAAFGSQRGFAPERLLLVGIAVTALLNAVTLLFLALGDPRLGQVLAWLAGSTYRITPGIAVAVMAVAFATLLLSLPWSRWLDILPFGDETARSVGVPVKAARLILLALATTGAAAAAMVVGPMSFTGLLAPYLARRAGLHGGAAQLVGAAAVGAALVVFADWVGRVIFAPTELPAGLLAILIGTTIAVAWRVRR